MQSVNTMERQPIEFKTRISQLNETEKKALIVTALMKDGFNQNQAANLLNVDRAHINRIAKKEKTGILAPYVNKAKKALRCTLEGKAVGDADKPKTSDVLNAAKMVFDREAPIIQRVESKNLNINLDLNDEDRERYKQILGMTGVSD